MGKLLVMFSTILVSLVLDIGVGVATEHNVFPRKEEGKISAESSRAVLPEVQQTLDLFASGNTNIVFGNHPDAVLVLGVTGFWYDEGPNPTMETYLQYFCPRVARLLLDHHYLRRLLHIFRHFFAWNLMIFTFLQICIVHAVDIYLSWDNKLQVLENMFFILVYNVVFITMATMMYKKEQCRPIIRLQRLIFKSYCQEDGEGKHKLQRTTKLCENITRYLQMAALLVIFALMLSAVIYYIPNRKFIVGGWYPYDKFASPAYEITLILWAVEISCLLVVANTFISLAATIWLIESAHFEILLQMMENVQTITTAKELSSNERSNDDRPIRGSGEFRSMLNLSPSANCDIPGCVVSLGSSATEVCDEMNIGRLLPGKVVSRDGLVVTLLHTQRPSFRRLQRCKSTGRVNEGMAEVDVEGQDQKVDGDISVDETPHQDIETELRWDLIELVKLHQKLLRLFIYWTKFWELLWFTLYFGNILLFALTTILVTTVDHISLREILLIFVWLQVLGLDFMCNYFADMNKTKATAVGEAVYACEWIKASPSFKLSMLIIMSRANVPLNVKPMGIGALSLKNFSETAYAAYKMLATTRTLTAK